MCHFKEFRFFVILFVGFCFIFSSCAAHHRNQVSVDSKNNLTVGTVQKEIKIGMSSADVVGVLGSPNIVTTDDQRREVWVYDRVSTETVYSKSGGGVFVLVFNAGSESGATSTTQKMLTIIIKFDDKSKVRDFSYHSSKF